MRLLKCALVALALSGTGCQSQSPLRPQALYIFGTARYADGTAVWRAKVWAEGGESTFSDPAGHFAIIAPATGDSVTLYARDGYTPGVVYASTRFGSVRVGGSPGRIRRDIVLDHITPI